MAVENENGDRYLYLREIYNEPEVINVFPGLGGIGGRGGMSPKKMKGMLKNMGIDIDELDGVKEVVIHMPDKEIVIENPSVAVMDAHGVRSYQISGDTVERPISRENKAELAPQIPDSDVELVASQTGASAESAKAALMETRGDLAAAIMKLASK
jgi:nascent polypeptide-associated complex subunit alpha